MLWGGLNDTALAVRVDHHSLLRHRLLIHWLLGRVHCGLHRLLIDGLGRVLHRGLHRLLVHWLLCWLLVHRLCWLLIHWLRHRLHWLLIHGLRHRLHWLLHRLGVPLLRHHLPGSHLLLIVPPLGGHLLRRHLLHHHSLGRNHDNWGRRGDKVHGDELLRWRARLPRPLHRHGNQLVDGVLVHLFDASSIHLGLGGDEAVQDVDFARADRGGLEGDRLVHAAHPDNQLLRHNRVGITHPDIDTLGKDVVVVTKPDRL